MRSLLLTALLLTASCRATDQSFETEDGRRVRDIPSLPYRVVLATIDADGQLEIYRAEAKKLEFTYSGEATQKLLAALLSSAGPPVDTVSGVHGLRRQNAFDDVRIAADPEQRAALLQAQAEGADLVIVPRLNDLPEFRSMGINGRWAVSTALWVTTWVLGLYVQDRRYLASLSFDFDIVNPYDGSVLATYTTTSGQMDATLVERNKGAFATDRTAISLLIPAWLIPDARARTSVSLSARACERIAAQLARHLKNDFAKRAREITGTLQRVTPDPRKPVGLKSMWFTASLVADEPITDIEVYLNDSDEPLYEAHASGDDGIAPPAKQAWGGVYRVTFETPTFELPQQENWLHVEFAVRGRFASQTFRYLRDPPKPPGNGD